MNEPTIIANIAEIVRQHRKAAGLSQRELAELAGIGKTVVFDVEHAKPTVQLNTLLKIFNTLNIQLTLHSRLMASTRHEFP